MAARGCDLGGGVEEGMVLSCWRKAMCERVCWRLERRRRWRDFAFDEHVDGVCRIVTMMKVE